jgi:TolB protein
VSPDSKQILFVQTTSSFRLISASLNDASTRTVIESQRRVEMPEWATKGDRFVYVSEAHGPPEIWLNESGGSERAIVTSAMLPAGTAALKEPALSPAGDRVAYGRWTPAEQFIWISSLGGGPPVRLTNGTSYEDMGTWSPDGSQIVYLKGGDGEGLGVMVAKTSGQATPVKLATGTGALPEWSPTGEWLAIRDPQGWELISPDGSKSRRLGQIATLHLTFSRDGRTLYGVRTEGDRQVLFSMPVDGGTMKTIGEIPREFAPRIFFPLGIRFSVAPDGKSLLFSTISSKASLWMLEGFNTP